MPRGRGVPPPIPAGRGRGAPPLPVTTETKKFPAKPVKDLDFLNALTQKQKDTLRLILKTDPKDGSEQMLFGQIKINKIATFLEARLKTTEVRATPVQQLSLA